MRCIFDLLRDDEAATAVEYAVLLAMILLTILGAIGTVGFQTNGLWSGNVNHLQEHGFIH